MIQDLDKEETLIYDIIKEYLNKKAFSPDLDLINFINQRLKSNSDFNRNKIEIIMRSLIKKKIILPGTKLKQEDVLESPLRRKIYRHINRNPGINMSEIISDLNIGNNQTAWHLENLEKFEFIKSEKIGNQKAYFNYCLDPVFLGVFFYLRKNKFNDVINLLKKKNAKSGLTPTKISKELKIHYNTIRKYLNILIDLHMIKIIKKKNQKRYLLNIEVYNEKLEDIKNNTKKVRSDIVGEFLIDIYS